MENNAIDTNIIRNIVFTIRLVFNSASNDISTPKLNWYHVSYLAYPYKPVYLSSVSY